MHIDVVTLFPEMVEGVTRYGVTGRAVENDLLSVNMHNPRSFAEDRHRTVDDRPYGGGPGMVMMFEPLSKAIQTARADHGVAHVVYLT
ncbi:MAG: tRNA (guanosine(37)-N1)-methyltransferase TrmD, partial [Gammaproteobacteria bacterium]|nr:tRNA (guanosine(37)-N1)-methyltransferase TrmD [Gammaproteobacteria bacterium]